MERVTRFELVTACLGSRCATTALHPHAAVLYPTGFFFANLVPGGVYFRVACAGQFENLLRRYASISAIRRQNVMSPSGGT